MQETEMKLENVKKSAKTGEKVATVMLIFCIVAFVITLVSGIVIFSMGSKFDEKVGDKEEFEEKFDDEDGARWFSISVGDITEWHSDIDFIQDQIDDHPLSFGLGTYLIIISGACLVLCVVLTLIKQTFGLLVVEDSPFTDKVRKKVLTTMIVLSVLAAMMLGFGIGAIGALLTWLVYTILDYGKTLQVLSDETL